MCVYLFEDHCGSYVRWKDKGLNKLTVVHLDAHLDLRDEGFTKKTLRKILESRSAKDLEPYRKNEDILWDGFHPGNYLYPALLDGTVSKLIWVIPPHLNKGENLLGWAREELQVWKNLTLKEYDSLRMKKGKVVGNLCGVPFEITHLENLKVEDNKTVWDIDVDFCFDQRDIPWISPFEMIDFLRNSTPPPLMVTIAYSVNGGYTAPHQKYIGDIIYKEVKKETKQEDKITYRQFKIFDELFSEGNIEKAISSLQNFNTISFKPYLYLRLSMGYKALGDLDKHKTYIKKVKERMPSLILPPYDEAMIYFRRKEYNKALSILEKVAQEDERHFLMSNFIISVMYMEQKNFSKASYRLEKITSSKSFGNWSVGVRSYIYFLLGVVLLKGEKYNKAVESLNKSIELDRENPRAYFYRGIAHQEMKIYDKALKDLRKFIYEQPNSLDVLEAHYRLAEIYKKIGKEGLRRGEMLILKKKDVTGYYTTKVLLDRNLFTFPSMEKKI